jgi:hypothetical protein
MPRSPRDLTSVVKPSRVEEALQDVLCNLTSVHARVVPSLDDQSHSVLDNDLSDLTSGSAREVVRSCRGSDGTRTMAPYSFKIKPWASVHFCQSGYLRLGLSGFDLTKWSLDKKLIGSRESANFPFPRTQT